MPDVFPIQNGVIQNALLPLLFNFTLEYAIMKVSEWNIPAPGLY